MKKLDLLLNCGGDKSEKYEICVQDKITRKISKCYKEYKPAGPDSFGHCDFKSIVTRGSMKYFITFIDDHYRFYHVYLLKSKDEAFDKFVEFLTQVKKQLRRPVKKLRCDKGGEYRSKEVETL